jgi:hypothetical protein
MEQLSGLALEVIEILLLPDPGQPVTLKVGNSDIQYNGTEFGFKKPTGGLVQYADDSTIEEVASRFC